MDEAILHFFESIRNPFLTAFLGLFSLLGEAVVLAAAALLLFWLLPRKIGEQTLFALVSGLCLNAFLKYTIARPRPYAAGAAEKLDPPLGSAPDDFASFPSGHTQMTAGFFGTLAFRFRRILYFVLCGAAVLLVGIARIYFGVHYPTDVLAGLFFGLFFALFWALVFKFAYPYRRLILLCIAALSLIPLCLSPSRDYLQAAGLVAGAAVSLAVLSLCGEETLPEFPLRLLRIPVGMALILLAFAISLLFPETAPLLFLKWFFLAVSSILCTKLTFEKLQI